jgi:hypothetical protein
MLQINDSDFTWMIAKMAIVLVAAVAALLGLAWVGAREYASGVKGIDGNSHISRIPDEGPLSVAIKPNVLPAN